MDDYIIYPISTTLIVTVILAPIIVIFAGLYEAFNFISSILPIITTIMIIISCILTVIPFSNLLLNKSKKFSGTMILHLFGSAIATSQLVFFLQTGINSLLTMETSGFALLWTLFVFGWWLIYGGVNALATYVLLFSTVGSFKKNEIEDYGLMSIGLCILGIVGWIVNLIVFVIF